MASWVHPWGDHLSAVFAGAALLFCLIALSTGRIPQAFPTAAAMLAWTVLGVAFVSTFVRHATGYAFAVLIVVAINSALWFAGGIVVEGNPVSSDRVLARGRLLTPADSLEWRNR
jgi:hypothetical protein